MSRYAQTYAAQAQIVQLFKSAGFDGELPPFLTSGSATGADSSFLGWLASNLRMEQHHMAQADVQRAREAEAAARQALDQQAEGTADALLCCFEEADDLAPSRHPDQQPPEDAAPVWVAEPGQDPHVAAWLEQPPLDALDAQLHDLAAERALYKAQIQELQALEAQVDAAHRASRAAHAAGQADEERMQRDAAAERAAAAGLNARVNALLQELQATLQDVQLLTQQHSSQWLMLVGSKEKDTYLQQSSQMMDILSRCNLEQPTEGFGSTLDATAAAGPGCPPPEEQESWLASNDPFSPPSPSSACKSAAAAPPLRGLSAEEEAGLMDELLRLGEAGKAAEASLVDARAEAAQHVAELEALRALRQGQAQGVVGRAGSGGGGPAAAWAPAAAMAVASDAQLAQLRDEAARLAADEARLASAALPPALDELSRQREAAVLAGHYALQRRVLGATLARRVALVRALLEHTARHQLLAAVQAAEHGELQALYSTVQDAERTLGGVVEAANRRCAVYASASIAASSSSSSSLSSSAALGRASTGMGGAGAAEGGVDRLERLLGQLAEHPGTQIQTQSMGSGDVAARLQGLHAAGVRALSDVSSTVYERTAGLTERSRAAAQEAHALLFAEQGQGQQGAGDDTAEASSICLHPRALGDKLHELRMAACEMNELINSTVAENHEYHRRLMERKEEVVAERAVLEWFHLNPDRLNEHVMGVEQRLAAMNL